MLGKILLASAAAVCLAGVVTVTAYDDASAQRRTGVTRGGARAPAVRSRASVRRPTVGPRRPSSIRRPVHSRSASPGTGHRRSLSPGGHRRGLSPGGHRRGLSPGGHRRGLSPGGHNRFTSPGSQHRRFGSVHGRRASVPGHWRRSSRNVHRRSWSWHARTSSWAPVPVVPRGPAPVGTPVRGAPVTAAPCNCTCLMTVYKGENLTGENREAREQEPDVGPQWDDQIASIYVSRGTWEVYTELNYQGQMRRLPPGPYLTLGPDFTRTISSLRCVP